MIHTDARGKTIEVGTRIIYPQIANHAVRWTEASVVEFLDETQQILVLRHLLWSEYSKPSSSNITVPITKILIRKALVIDG